MLALVFAHKAGPLLAMVLFVMAFVWSLAGWAVGRYKGRGPLGGWLGFLLGLPGVLVMCFLPPTGAARALRAARKLGVEEQVTERLDPPHAA
jgi:hypothetical protein